MTTDEAGKQFVYDAWNRLVRVKNSGGATLETFAHDGLGRRVSVTAGSTTTDLYYSAAWQVLEEKVGSNTMARYVWSPVYVDGLVLRDRDADGNSANGLEERLWVQQDANWNVTALVDGTGAVVERYAYDPFGAVTVYDASYNVRTGGSSYAWVYGFQGLRYDVTAGLNFTQTRPYSPTLGRPIQPDWLGLGPDNNYYRWEVNNPLKYTDPRGTDITLETGNNTGKPGNDDWHQQICVDSPSGKICFSFGATGPGIWIGGTWLGQSSSTFCVMTGQVYVAQPVPGARIDRRRQTTPAEDRAFLQYMTNMVMSNTRDGYSVARHNCRMFSQREFENAPGIEVPVYITAPLSNCDAGICTTPRPHWSIAMWQGVERPRYYPQYSSGASPPRGESGYYDTGGQWVDTSPSPAPPSTVTELVWDGNDFIEVQRPTITKPPSRPASDDPTSNF